ncbi:MAG: AI-2E family transporter [Gammaproteobacteria bacterium]|nr:AI-2E family transporter [Gammaproteobacteria bacterium]MCK5262194.1 AI-2E family transporter [Gammaproteobacteria bacterium]
MQDTGFSKTSRAILVAAALVIVVAGMKQAASLLVPFFLSVFIAILCLPVMLGLQKKGVGEIASLFVVVALVMIAGLGIAVLIGSSADDFSRNLPAYQLRITQQWQALIQWLATQGIALPSDYLNSNIDPKSAMRMVASILSGFGNVLTNSFLILLTVIFILLEAATFSKKIEAIGGNQEGRNFSTVFTEKLRRYMSIKTWMSAVTGVLVALWLWLLGVDYPALWGVLAFMLNYVPNIGSIIAAVPAVLLALVQMDTGTAILVMSGYLVINVIMGNVVEPKYMGKGLGLSALVVFLSLVFWGWVLGTAGMLLSVPLTVAVKLALDSKKESQWLGALLGSAD